MKIKINNYLLSWARKKENLSKAEVARRIGKSIDVINKWESCEDYPTYSQLEKLAYDILKKPIAIFFFPEPPVIEDIKSSFRSLPNTMFTELPNTLIRLLNNAKEMQINLYELNNNINLEFEKFRNSIKHREDTKSIRALLSINLSEQYKFNSTKQAFETWREKFEENGIYVFKEAFKNNDFSGFCLYDDVFPIIFVNNSMSFSRQIFTLFHELYHILTKTSGIDLQQNNWLNRYTHIELQIETQCNTFANEFLVPKKSFIDLVRDENIDESFIKRIAKLFTVSREVIMINLLSINLISREFYEKKRQEYISEALRYKAKKKGGDYYNTKITYLGPSYIKLVYNKFYSSKFSKFQLADYLNIKFDNLNSLQSKLYERGL